MGGQMTFNSGGFSASEEQMEHWPPQMKDNLRRVVSRLQAPNLKDKCIDECSTIRGYINLMNSVSDSSKYAGVTVTYSGSTFDTSPETSFTASVNPEAYYNNSNIAYVTGVMIDEVVRIGDDEFALRDVYGASIATCEKVILSGGAIGTPALVKRSPTLRTDMQNVGQGLADHYGCVVTAVFLNAPQDATPNYWTNGLATIIGPGKLAQVIPVCFPRVSTNSSDPDAPLGPLVCAVIVYGAMHPPRTGSVHADGTYEWGVSLTEEYKRSYSIAFNATIDAMEASWGFGMYTMLEYPTEVFGETRKTDENVNKQKIQGYMMAHVAQLGANQYHHLASMIDAVSADYKLDGEPNILVADASVLDGWPGSLVAPIAAIGYHVGRNA
jgi:hypothetical protein